MKKIQLYVDSDKDSKVYELIERIEEEGTTGYKEVTDNDGAVIKRRTVKRGFVQDRIKDYLEAYAVLSNRLGTSDPYKILEAFLTSDSSAAPTEDSQQEKPSSLKGFVDQGKNGFMMD